MGEWVPGLNPIEMTEVVKLTEIDIVWTIHAWQNSSRNNNKRKVTRKSTPKSEQKLNSSSFDLIPLAKMSHATPQKA